MKITELFISSFDWSWKIKNPSFHTAEFKIPDSDFEYLVVLKKIKFIRNIIPKDWDLEKFKGHQIWSCDFSIKSSSGQELDPFGITGTGNAAKVMSTIIDIIKEFKASLNADLILYFTAFKPSRIKLYSKISQRLAMKTLTFVDDVSVTNFLVFV